MTNRDHEKHAITPCWKSQDHYKKASSHGASSFQGHERDMRPKNITGRACHQLPSITPIQGLQPSPWPTMAQHHLLSPHVSLANVRKAEVHNSAHTAAEPGAIQDLQVDGMVPRPQDMFCPELPQHTLDHGGALNTSPLGRSFV